MVPQGAPILKTGSDRQIVVVSDDAIVITDQDRTRIFDKTGVLQGAAIMKTGSETQRVRINGNRILVTDADSQVRTFDLNGNAVGAPIPVTYAEEYDVELFAQFFTITDDFNTVTIYDRDAQQQGQPISIGYGVQHVQATEDRILVIDDNLVRMFDAQGAQLGSSFTTSGEPEAQPVCWQAGAIELFGTGCGGATQAAYGDARIGGTLTYEVNGPASTIGMMGLGFDNLASPINLAGLGAPGCFAYSSLAITYGLITDTEGLATINLTMPSAELYVGAQFTTQFYVVDLAANNLGVIASDAARTTLGEGM